MGSRAADDPCPNTVDPACVPDIFVEGIGMIERIAGNCLRITLYANRNQGGGEIERMVVARIVVSTSLASVSARQIEAFVQGVPFMTDLAAKIMPS